MMRAPLPPIGATIEVTWPGHKPARYELRCYRDLGDGRYVVLALDAGANFVSFRVGPADGGWVALPPVMAVSGAIRLAERVRRGETLPGPATAPLAALADAVLALAGLLPVDGRPAPLVCVEGCA
ncbi:hypothetical protein [Azospirillum halopraeferens]|uniref:hypothetical protein n=1 Tax=Azospirillum halopraeferens TaxID=34010 RepID=UPI0003FC1AAA|nr:hypothetical protein [Azospirillum halopraeferens]